MRQTSIRRAAQYEVLSCFFLNSQPCDEQVIFARYHASGAAKC
jgi:hypothetical protein